MSDEDAGGVVDNAARQRFELAVQGQIAIADYRRIERDGVAVLVIPHVETPPALRGGGVAGRLMAGIAAIARARAEKIVPSCPYAAAWFRRHPEEMDLVA